jgi:hypothetical protein
MRLHSGYLVETKLLVPSRWEAFGTNPGVPCHRYPTTDRAPSTIGMGILR